MKKHACLFSLCDAYESITDLYCITLLFLFLLFPGFSGYLNITLSKYYFLLIATGLWLLALLAARICGVKRRLHPSAPQWAALIFLAVSVLSTLCSPNFFGSLIGTGRFDGLLTTLLYCVIFLGVSLFTRPKPVHAYAFGCAVTLCCFLAVLQLLGKNPLGLYPSDLRWQDAGIRYSGAYLGTIGNTNLLDAVLALSIPLCICEVLRRRWWFLLPLLLSVPIVIWAGGSGLHFALCGFVCAALLLLPRRRSVRFFCIGLIAAMLVIALAVLWFWKGESGTVYELSQMLHGRFEDSFGSSRIMIWRESLALVPARPLLGGGPGTLASRLDITFSRYVPETGVTLTSFADNAHNVYLAYLVDIGILGLLSYLALLLSSALCALKYAARSDLVLAFSLSVFCAAVHAFFGLGLFITQPFFFLMIGLCASTNISLEEASSCNDTIKS